MGVPSRPARQRRPLSNWYGLQIILGKVRPSHATKPKTRPQVSIIAPGDSAQADAADTCKSLTCTDAVDVVTFGSIDTRFSPSRSFRPSRARRRPLTCANTPASTSRQATPAPSERRRTGVRACTCGDIRHECSGCKGYRDSTDLALTWSPQPPPSAHPRGSSHHRTTGSAWAVGHGQEHPHGRRAVLGPAVVGDEARGARLTAALRRMQVERPEG